MLGWSFGGPLALMLASAEPDRARSIILSASFVRPPRRILSSFGFALNGSALVAWRAARRLPLWLLKPRQDLFRMAKAQTWREVPASVIAARLQAIRRLDARELLRGCPQPLLYLAARNDGTVPRRNAEEIARLRPDTVMKTIEGRHFAMFSHPRESAAAIARFIESSAAARVP